ncbi:SDR family oxidoreductase [Cellulomonas sp. URHD0024]|uniref:SDR family oxidoreductase n=1 Tax=Cellulomonas sp. URHD0024 TaxID=1302620 RepID=UPI00040BCF98|nr:SDR family oxidoreductase [Cellulomonas sp. URHD0024]
MRTVVVTGAASGIGLATKELLESRGERVIGVDLHDSDVVVDLTSADGRRDLVEQARDLSGGTIDAIAAIAGVASSGAAVVAVNYFGALATLEGLRPLLAGSSAPRAVVTSSMSSLLPRDDELVDLCLADQERAALDRADTLVDTGLGRLVYGTSKAALSRWLRRSAPAERWAGAGIPLNAIAPGIVKTPLVASLISTPERREALAEQVPMPLNGFMEPSAPAALLAWLISEENTHLCGQVVFIDGGSDAVLRGDSTW